MQKIVIIGALGRDPDLRTTQTGIPVCSFSVATNSRRSDKETTTWFRVTTWRGLAETCAKHLKKGSKVGVSGELTLGIYTGKDGKDRASLEVQADEVEFLSPRQESVKEPNIPEGMVPVVDDSVPF